MRVDFVISLLNVLREVIGFFVLNDKHLKTTFSRGYCLKTLFHESERFRVVFQSFYHQGKVQKLFRAFRTALQFKFRMAKSKK